MLILIEFFSFSWLSSLINIGRKKPIEEEDLFKPLPDDETEYLTNKLELYY